MPSIPMPAASHDGPRPITITRILRDVAASYRHRPARIAISAAIVFGIAAVLGVVSNEILDRADDDALLVAFALGGLVAQALGITFYAGLLDAIVGESELGQDPRSVGQVLRTLPYGRLIAADLLVVVVTVLGLVLLVIPGVVAFTLFAITGPIIGLERLGPIAAMRRSARLVRRHFWLALLLVTIPLQVEHQVVYWVSAALLEHPLVEIFLVHGLVGVLVDSFVGLVGVNLAYALVVEDRGSFLPVTTSDRERSRLLRRQAPRRRSP